MRDRAGALETEIAVVGLGAMGSAALFHLARRGHRVVGIEQFQPGQDRGSSHGESRAIRLGYFEHPSYVPLARAAYQGWYELERLTGQSVLTRTGVLEIGKPGSIIVDGSLAASRQHGLEHELLGASEIMVRYPQFNLPRDYAAIWQPDGGFVRPELANSLHLQLAQEAGAKVISGCRIDGIEPAARGVSLRTVQGTMLAQRVVIAAGAWIGALVPRLAAHLTLTRQVQCWFAPGRMDDFAVGRLPVFIIDGDDDACYGFPVVSERGFKCASHHDSGTLASADAARQDAGPEDEARIRRFLEAYLPSAAGLLTGMKTCIYTKTRDEDFVIDRLPEDPRIVIASPCSGHGFKFASVIGAVLADLATQGSTRHDISRFSLARVA